MQKDDTETDELDQGPRRSFAKILAKQLIEDVGITTAPVSLQQVIDYLQRERNITIQKESMPKMISGLLVVIKKLDKEYVSIGINELDPWCRRRFSLGHELGHLLLGHNGCSGGISDGSYNENEANAFSSELLMPTKLVKEDFKRTPNIQALSKLYLVSSEAMGYKIMNAHLLGAK